MAPPPGCFVSSSKNQQTSWFLIIGTARISEVSSAAELADSLVSIHFRTTSRLWSAGLPVSGTDLPLEAQYLKVTPSLIAMAVPVAPVRKRARSANRCTDARNSRLAVWIRDGKAAIGEAWLAASRCGRDPGLAVRDVALRSIGNESECRSPKPKCQETKELSLPEGHWIESGAVSGRQPCHV